MSRQQFIIITGFMGSGKTTVAQALAKTLKRSVLDLDQVITAREGTSPKEIIERDGEAAFREDETRILREVLEEASPGIVALGGGAWTTQGNRDLIAELGGLTVWLDVPFEVCWQRILAAGTERPLAREEFQARSLYAERRAHYGFAQLHVEAGENESLDEICAQIVGALMGHR
jgi:shikimate kinase